VWGGADGHGRGTTIGTGVIFVLEGQGMGQKGMGPRFHAGRAGDDQASAWWRALEEMCRLGTVKDYEPWVTGAVTKYHNSTGRVGIYFRLRRKKKEFLLGFQDLSTREMGDLPAWIVRY